MSLSSPAAAALLRAGDPAPVEIVNADSAHPVALVCEHAGKTVPEALNALGLSEDELSEHIGWDIGAAAVTRIMADLLGAPAAFQRYSRLVIDCNRPIGAEDSIPAVSDGVTVPGNAGLSEEDRAAREREIFAPFQAAVADMLTRRPRQAAFAIHSFTPVLGGVVRPWDVGFLFRRDARTSLLLARAVEAEAPDLLIGMNEPYTIDDLSDWFVPQHGERLSLAHSLVEIRNDLIRTPAEQERWARILASAIETIMPELDT